MDIKEKKILARQFAKTIKAIDFMPAYTIDTTEEARAILEVRSKAMEGIFKLGFDLNQKYKICKKKVTK